MLKEREDKIIWNIKNDSVFSSSEGLSIRYSLRLSLSQHRLPQLKELLIYETIDSFEIWVFEFKAHPDIIGVKPTSKTSLNGIANARLSLMLQLYNSNAPLFWALITAEDTPKFDVIFQLY